MKWKYSSKVPTLYFNYRAWVSVHCSTAAPHWFSCCSAVHQDVNGVKSAVSGMWCTLSTTSNEKNKDWIWTNIANTVELKHAFISSDTDLAEWLGAFLLHSSVFSCSAASCLLLSLPVVSDLSLPVQFCCNLPSLVLLFLLLRFVLLWSDPGQGC